jgi:sugar lactone lactonase YvrE
VTADPREEPIIEPYPPSYRRVRVVLGMVLLLLLALLIGLILVVARLLSPLGAPSTTALPSGLEWVRSIYGWGKAESQQLRGPSDVAVGPDGTIWVSDAQRWQVIAFEPDGSYRTLVHLGPGVIVPQSIDVSSNNEIYICDYAHDRIVVMSPDSELLREWPVPSPTEIDVTGGVVTVGSRSGVASFDERGELIAVWGSPGKLPEEFDLVRGIVAGPGGTLYVSDTHNSRLKAYEPDGTLKWVYPAEADFARFEADPESDPPYEIPTGMTLDGNGRLVLVDPFNFAIIVVDPATGLETARYGEFGVEDGFFAYPTSISYDPVRDWFAVADTANNRVQIVRIPGSGGGLLQALSRATVGPWWVCLVPLLLILVALALMALRRRRAAERRERLLEAARQASADESAVT